MTEISGELFVILPAEIDQPEDDSEDDHPQTKGGNVTDGLAKRRTNRTAWLAMSRHEVR